MLHYYDSDGKFEALKEWYDGYRSGTTQIYCPWDVIDQCDKFLTDTAAPRGASDNGTHKLVIPNREEKHQSESEYRKCYQNLTEEQRSNSCSLQRASRPTYLPWIRKRRFRKQSGGRQTEDIRPSTSSGLGENRKMRSPQRVSCIRWQQPSFGNLRICRNLKSHGEKRK